MHTRPLLATNDDLDQALELRGPLLYSSLLDFAYDSLLPSNTKARDLRSRSIVSGTCLQVDFQIQGMLEEEARALKDLQAQVQR